MYNTIYALNFKYCKIIKKTIKKMLVGEFYHNTTKLPCLIEKDMNER